jgi:hypothetical protein
MVLRIFLGRPARLGGSERPVMPALTFRYGPNPQHGPPALRFLYAQPHGRSSEMSSEGSICPRKLEIACLPPTPVPLILRRLFDMVDDEDFHGALCRF